MAVHYDKESETYYERCRVSNQTIELGINFVCDIDDTKSYWNIYLTIFNKRKDMYTNMDKIISTGTNIFANVKTAINMFYNVEAYLLQRELMSHRYSEVIISCTWMDNRRRDAYYKVLHKHGYDWGMIGNKKCIMKTYKYEDINPEVRKEYE